MAKKELNLETVKALGVGKLSQIVLDEAELNAPFRKRLKAALAGLGGPEQVVKMIDRRLAGLNRARSFIDWNKASAFAKDLQALVDTIDKELALVAPDLAAGCLLRFISTHENVFERIDDSSGRVQDVYYQAIAVLGEVAERLSGHGADLPDQIMSSLGETTHGYLVDVTDSVVPHLPKEVLHRWDADLVGAIARREAEERTETKDGWQYSMTSQWRSMRRTLAVARGDLDLLIELESEQPAHMSDTLGLAELLLEAGRVHEALEWVRKPRPRSRLSETQCDPGQVSIEAEILSAQGETGAAADLLWQGFSNTLNADLLRTYLKALPDFDDMDAEERAMEVACHYPDRLKAVTFLIDWPRHDLAASLIVAQRSEWKGSDWHILPVIAETLQHEHPLAATILYRRLLDDILAKARSKAYGHGSRYFEMLGYLAEAAESDPNWPDEMEEHAEYAANLREANKRKVRFWSLVKAR